MGEAAAYDFLAEFVFASSYLDKLKFIQVSSDGPNIKIWNFLIYWRKIERMKI